MTATAPTVPATTGLARDRRHRAPRPAPPSPPPGAATRPPRWNGETTKASSRVNAAAHRGRPGPGARPGPDPGRHRHVLPVGQRDGAPTRPSSPSSTAARFRPEFRPAFDAWLATDPLTDPRRPRRRRSPWTSTSSRPGADAERLDGEAEATGGHRRAATCSGPANYVLARRPLRRRPLLRRHEHEAARGQTQDGDARRSAASCSSAPPPGSPRSPSASRVLRPRAPRARVGHQSPMPAAGCRPPRSPRGHVELAVHAAHVGLQRVERHVQRGRDLPVGEAAAQVAQHGHLPLAERLDQRRRRPAPDGGADDAAGRTRAGRRRSAPGRRPARTTAAAGGRPAPARRSVRISRSRLAGRRGRAGGGRWPRSTSRSSTLSAHSTLALDRGRAGSSAAGARAAGRSAGAIVVVEQRQADAQHAASRRGPGRARRSGPRRSDGSNRRACVAASSPSTWRRAASGSV